MMKTKLLKEFFLNFISLEKHFFNEKDKSPFSLSEFIVQINNKSIMDYDGFGIVLYKGKEIKNAELYVDLQLIGLSDSVFFPLDRTYKIFKDDINIVWYNK